MLGPAPAGMRNWPVMWTLLGIAVMVVRFGLRVYIRAQLPAAPMLLVANTGGMAALVYRF